MKHIPAAQLVSPRETTANFIGGSASGHKPAKFIAATEEKPVKINAPADTSTKYKIKRLNRTATKTGEKP